MDRIYDTLVYTFPTLVYTGMGDRNFSAQYYTNLGTYAWFQAYYILESVSSNSVWAEGWIGNAIHHYHYAGGGE